ncbi:MAG: S-layer homology domain-containing protein, partial [Lachnospiraceae bacterium]|nr:S-layer homology domain-containing protein [Lachnospiraceae bacterium]
MDAFKDGKNIHGWAEEVVAWCVENGIIKGQGGGILAPG